LIVPASLVGGWPLLGHDGHESESTTKSTKRTKAT
jgi:hypothetical protein